MGRWYTSEGNPIKIGDEKVIIGWAYSDIYAQTLTDAHNADCAAYEARISELERQTASGIMIPKTAEQRIMDAVERESRLTAEVSRLKKELSICRESERMLEGEKDAAHSQLSRDQAELAAANATLDRLREVVPPGEADAYEGRSYAVYSQWLCEIAAILYPPKEPTDDER